MNDYVFAKIIQNIRNYRDIKLVTMIKEETD